MSSPNPQNNGRLQQHQYTSNQTNSSPGMGRIYRFFCWCSGVNTDILEEYPTEWNKYFGTGTIVCMTGLFAFLAASFALSSVFFDKEIIETINPTTKEVTTKIVKNIYWTPIYIGAAAWAMFIFFLDRFLVGSMVKRGSKWQEFRIAFPRIILAFFISLTIARPLEIRIAQDEIMQFLGDEQETKIVEIDSLYEAMILEEGAKREQKIGEASGRSDIGSLKNQIGKIRAQIDTSRLRVKKAFDEVECECKGVCGTGRAGYGPVCKGREREYSDLKKEYEKDKQIWDKQIVDLNTRIRSYDAQIDTTLATILQRSKERLKKLQEEKKRRIKNVEQGFATSILAQNSALSKLSTQDAGVAAMMWVLTILFIIIECAPIFAKLFLSKGPYDDRILDIEYQTESESRQRRFLTRQELKVNKDLINKMAVAQRDVIREAMETWRDQQMEEMEENIDNYIHIDENENQNQNQNQEIV